MIPTTENIDDLISIVEASGLENTKTFGINLNDNIVGGYIDDLAALKQSIYLMLSIEADKHIIYPYTYGVHTIDLIGKPSYYVVAVLPERIREALMTDDRILNVSDFEFNVDKNKIHVTFVVTSIYGNIVERTEVIY
jgi:hypothetical protein